jgi:hypothetical protein
MRLRLRLSCIVAFLGMVCAASALADDQQKAEKQLKKVTAMAADVNARAIVSRATAEMLGVTRDQLVRERRAMNLNYGEVFLAHQLTAKGAKMLDIALKLPLEKSIYRIANDQHADWKEIAAEAKKLNGKIEDSIYKHFLHAKADKEQEAAEKYNATLDWVKADAETTPADILEAQEIYVLWRNRAGEIGGKGNGVSSSEELASQRIEERAHDVRISPTAPH